MIAGTRVSVQLLFHWYKSGMEWEKMLTIATSVTREDLEEVKQFIAENEAELMEQRERISERIERERAEIARKFPQFGQWDHLPPEERRDRMLARLKQRQAETNGDHDPRG